jgi:hypothetical protein
MEMRVRSAPSLELKGKSLLVAKEGPKLRAVSWSGWVPVRLTPTGVEPRWKRLQAGVLKEETKRYLEAGGDLKKIEDYSSTRGPASAAFEKVDRKGTAAFSLRPGSFKAHYLGMGRLGRLTGEELRMGLRGKLEPVPGENAKLDNLLQHAVSAGAAVLLIGDKYIAIPRRSSKVSFYPDLFHAFSGRIRVDKAKEQYESPQQTALREVSSETGINRKQLVFLGPGFKPTHWKKAVPFMVVRTLDIASLDLLYALKVNAADPDRFVKQNFLKTGDGNYAVKPSGESWEHSSVEIIPQTKEAVDGFVRKHREDLSPTLAMILHAFKKALD